ncbi:hypothetical protein DXG01_002908 [Tephrocybe rancida]|nr:hypothetical protein DXG01_002908 [Tephrocybe rancida]
MLYFTQSANSRMPQTASDSTTAGRQAASESNNSSYPKDHNRIFSQCTNQQYNYVLQGQCQRKKKLVETTPLTNATPISTTGNVSTSPGPNWQRREVDRVAYNTPEAKTRSPSEAIVAKSYVPTGDEKVKNKRPETGLDIEGHKKDVARQTSTTLTGGAVPVTTKPQQKEAMRPTIPPAKEIQHVTDVSASSGPSLRPSDTRTTPTPTHGHIDRVAYNTPETKSRRPSEAVVAKSHVPMGNETVKSKRPEIGLDIEDHKNDVARQTSTTLTDSAIPVTTKPEQKEVMRPLVPPTKEIQHATDVSASAGASQRPFDARTKPILQHTHNHSGATTNLKPPTAQQQPSTGPTNSHSGSSMKSLMSDVYSNTDRRVVEDSYEVVSPSVASGGELDDKGENQPSSRIGIGSGEPMSYPAALAYKRADLDGSVETDASSIRNSKGSSWTLPSLGFSKLFKGGKPSVSASKTDIGDRDVVIAVMGRLGREGKRSFITDAFVNRQYREDNNLPSIHFIVTSDVQSDPSRSIFLVYSTGDDDQKLSHTLRDALSWLSESCGDKRKFSGLIYLEDCSAGSPTKLSSRTLDLLDKCVERSNIVVATTGWDDDIQDVTSLEVRHKELVDQWRSFVERGVSVLRLPVPGKTSRDTSHTSRDVVKHLITRTDEKITVTKRSVWKGKEKKAEDTFLEEPRDTDIVIPIMGPTGAGKSTFINWVAGQNVAVVGHNLKSETAQLQHVILTHPTDPTRRIIVVDTPGFDDTYVADSEILRRIAVWLAQSYSANMTLAGVIYLHEISQTRMLGTARKNLDMFNKLIGKDATKNVVLATTKWGDIPDEVGGRREEQLRERHWKWMVDLGAKLFRFTDSRESGWAIIQHILDQAAAQDVDAVEIQQELVEVKKILPDTEAGQALLYTLEELLENQRMAAAQLRKDESSDQAKAIMHETDQKIRATLRQINDLSGNRLKAWWKKRFTHRIIPRILRVLAPMY